MIIYFVVVTEASAALTDACAILGKPAQSLIPKGVSYGNQGDSWPELIDRSRYYESLELYQLEVNLLLGKVLM